MSGLGHAIVAYIVSAAAIFGYAWWVWRGHVAATRRSKPRS